MTLAVAVIFTYPTEAGKVSEQVTIKQAHPTKTNGVIVNIDDYKMEFTTTEAVKEALALLKKIGLVIGNVVLDAAIKKLKTDTGAIPNKEKPLGAEIRRKQFCKKGPEGFSGCYTIVGKNEITGDKFTAMSIRSCGGLLCGLSDKLDDAIIAVCGPS